MGEPQKNFGYAVQTTKNSREHSREKENSMNQDQRDKNALTMLFSILELQTIRSLKKTNKNYKIRTSKYRYKKFHNIKRSMSACFQLHTDKNITN